MTACFSPEGQIETWLRESGCSGRQFVEIAKSLNVSIAHGPFSEALSDKKPFERATGEQLVAMLDELKSLRKVYPDVPIAWGSTERIATLVVLARVRKIEMELDGDTDCGTF